MSRPVFTSAPLRYEALDEGRFRDQVAAAIARLHGAGADIELGGSRAILTSPDGTRYYFAATDDGLVYLVNVETGVAAVLPATVDDIAALDTRLDALEEPPVVVRAQRITSAQSLVAGAGTVAVFNSELEDSHGAYNPATGVFTAPVAGWYIISGAVGLDSATAKVAFVSIRVNGTFRAVQGMAIYGATSNYGVVCIAYKLAANDTVDITVACDSTSVSPVLVAQDWVQLNISTLTGIAPSIGGGGSSAWADITGKPTTLGGFGITDAYTDAEVDTLIAGVNGGDPLAIHTDTTDMDVLYTANCSGSPSGATTSLTLNSLRVVPFIAPARGGTLDQIGVQITSATALSNIRLGVYESKAFNNLYPGALLFDSGNISSASGGVKTAACSLVLQPGRVYWLAILGSHTVSAYGFAAANASAMLGVDPVNYSSSIGFRSKAQAFGALPDPAPAALAATGGNVPRLSYRFSA